MREACASQGAACPESARVWRGARPQGAESGVCGGSSGVCRGRLLSQDILGSSVYSRLIKKAPEKIIRDGGICFGTFSGVPAKLDIRGVRRPFAGIPLPSFLSNLHIKGRLACVFTAGEFIGMTEFFDTKVFGFAEVVFWNMTTGQRFAYHTMMATRRRIVPADTRKAVCVSYSKARYIRAAWNRARGKATLSFVVRGDSCRPAAKGSFTAPFGTEDVRELLSVTPAPTVRRCSATWMVPLRVRGGITTGKHRRKLAEPPEQDGLALLLVNRTYTKFRSRSEILCGIGETGGRSLIFRFASSNYDAVDSDSYNDNILVADGQITAMPPVCITHPFGLDRKWVVQDTESMVDLAFTPVSTSSRTLNILVLRNVCVTIYGTFDGVLRSSDGEKIALKNFPGVIRKNMLRR